METFVTTVHVLAAIFMIFVVLVQEGNKGGIGAAFGGGNTQGVFGASGATSLLAKMTYGFAAIFMCTSITLAVMSGRGGRVDGFDEKLRKAQREREQSLKIEKTEAPKQSEIIKNTKTNKASEATK
tara:strand:+ start:139 stop:516 length:378 start_codon:yes stop_codon:yes gene_type:complete